MPDIKDIQQHNPPIDSVNVKSIYPMAAREWFHEAWMHHRELGTELFNLSHLMDILNGSNKKSIEPEIIRTIQEINIQIKFLGRHYNNFEMKKLDSNPTKNLVKMYMEYNTLLIQKAEWMMANIKFSYN